MTSLAAELRLAARPAPDVPGGDHDTTSAGSTRPAASSGARRQRHRGGVAAGVGDPASPRPARPGRRAARAGRRASCRRAGRRSRPARRPASVSRKSAPRSTTGRSGGQLRRPARRTARAAGRGRPGRRRPARPARSGRSVVPAELRQLRVQLGDRPAGRRRPPPPGRPQLGVGQQQPQQLAARVAAGSRHRRRPSHLHEYAVFRILMQTGFSAGGRRRHHGVPLVVDVPAPENGLARSGRPPRAARPAGRARPPGPRPGRRPATASSRSPARTAPPRRPATSAPRRAPAGRPAGAGETSAQHGVRVGQGPEQVPGQHRRRSRPGRRRVSAASPTRNRHRARGTWLGRLGDHARRQVDADAPGDRRPAPAGRASPCRTRGRAGRTARGSHSVSCARQASRAAGSRSPWSGSSS